MYRFTGFTDKANNAINHAVSLAASSGHCYIGSEHLLYGILKESGCVGSVALHQNGLKADELRLSIIKSIGKSAPTTMTPNDFTPRLCEIMENALLIAKNYNHELVGTGHILIAMISEKDSFISRHFKSMKIDEQLLEIELTEALGGYKQEYNYEEQQAAPKKQAAKKSSIVEKNSTDLTEQAAQGLLDPVVGRSEEIERIVQILSRRKKNNPCLIGEAGVGKTAIVEGLAQRIISGTVPENLLGKRILSLELSSVVAGTKYRGEFEEKVRAIIDEVVSCGNIILFIDELHNIMGVGSAEGAIDAANILKPQLARGGIQVIGATTIEEYRKRIEKDAAIERRFQCVIVKEPTEEQAIRILKGLKPKYEEYHKLSISNEAIEASVRLAKRYIYDRFLPDKAIDILDETASRVKIKYSAGESAAESRKRFQMLKRQKKLAFAQGDLELAGELGERQKQLGFCIETVDSIDKNVMERFVPEIKAADITKTVSKIIGMGIEESDKQERKRLLELEGELEASVIGQNEAVRLVSHAIRRARVGLGNKRRPVGSFIFLGPSGVGKTFLCKALAKSLFGREDAIIKLDMSEYMEKHTVSRMVGSPPGYVGHDDAGQLTEKIRRNPHSIVVFDEIEKAHPDVYNILLQILEDGVLTDSHGKSANFSNAIIVLTSNKGSAAVNQRSFHGFADSAGADYKKEMKKELTKLFNPELIGRIDDIVVFNKLTQAELVKIAARMLEATTAQLRDIGIEISFDSSVCEWLAKTVVAEGYGARPLRKIIREHVEDVLTQRILSEELGEGDCITIKASDGELEMIKNEEAQKISQP